MRLQVRHRLGGPAQRQAGLRLPFDGVQPQLRQPGALAPAQSSSANSAYAGPRHRLSACSSRGSAPSGGRVAAADTSCSKRQASTASASARSAYPGPSVTSSRAGVRGGRCGSSARRSAATNVRTAPTAAGGGSVHRSSTSRDTGTTRRRAMINRASTARCRGPFSAMACPSASQATTGPSTPNPTRMRPP
ncbi:hypothetical protein GCM10017744_046420 [Streptomyces antimycoticus]